MVRTDLSCLLVCCSLLLVACGTDGGSTVTRDTADQSGADQVGPGDLVAETVVGVDADTWPRDATVDLPDLSYEPDDFGSPCSDNGDCLGGLCVPHHGEMICTHECVEECPDGFTCTTFSSGPDMLFACLSLAPSLCLPCAASDECQPGPGVPAACVRYPGEGAFCGAKCSELAPCPQGMVCLNAEAVEGGNGTYCVQETGPCPCTQYAIDTGLSTPCERANDFGLCPGLRECVDGGLTACNAQNPGEEFCNGSDDDCDGLVDEGTCDDGNPCTADTCNPNQGCQFEPQEGMECDDGDPCTVAEVCLAGNCQGTPVLCNDDNPCTDDTCDSGGGCTFAANQAACDDGSPCTVGDTCKAGECQGTAVSCECQSNADCGVYEDGNICNGTLFCDTSKVPYQCQPQPDSTIDCPAPEGKNKLCLAAYCDPVDGSCSLIAANNGIPCDDGNKCTYGETCSEGACLGGKPLNCNDGNPCTDEACQPSIGCTHTDNDGPCDDGDLCTINDVCAGGECTPGGQLSCDDNNACTNDICSPVKGCLHTNNSQPCNDLDPCTEQDTCSGGVCLGTVPKDCDDANPCTNDLCIPLAGCSHTNNTSPCDDGNPCSVGDKCLGGSCNPGQKLNCDDGNVCTDDSCDPEKGCLHVSNAAPCDDNNSCTSADQCVKGACVGSGDLDCDDANPCTKDLCLADGGCQYENIAAPCSDGDPCTVGDICAAGECTAGPPMDCNDGNVCTADSCNPESGLCVHSAAEGACDDGNPCTLVDSCQGGKCVGTSAPKCDDDNVCTTDYCDPGQGCVHLLNTSPCDDDNLCTTKDTCQLGECVGGPALNCGDNNPCTDDDCQADVGCTFTPNNAPCSDGNACTDNDQCKAGWCSGAAVTCSDQNLCTADSCDPATGCQYLPAPGPCDDGNACTTSDSCQAGECLGGAAPNCNDDNVCTEDSCDADKGCVHTPVAGPCDDSNPCTVNDLCDAGECKAGPDTLDCTDDNICTDDSCSADSGCVHVNNDASCDDGNACTLGDTCSEGSCKAGGEAKNCNDNDPCTVDSCDPDSGCQHSGGNCQTFSHAFAAGNTTGAACSKWNQWRAALTGSYTKVTIRGSYDMVGVSCTGASANQICQALRNNQTGSWNCGGRSWQTGQCGGAIEVNANGNMCSCNGNYTVRPCIDYPGSPNPNWGGAKTEVCSGPSQTLEITCE